MTEAGPNLQADNDLRSLARIGDRLHRASEYVEDVRFLRNKIQVLSKQVGPLQRVADAAFELEKALGKSPLAREARRDLVDAILAWKGISRP